MSKNSLPVTSPTALNLQSIETNLLRPSFYFLLFALWQFTRLLIVPSIALGTGCIIPCNYVAYNQVGEAEIHNNVKKHIIRYSLVVIKAGMRTNSTGVGRETDSHRESGKAWRILHFGET